MNLEIVENSNIVATNFIFYLINWIFASKTIQGRKLFKGRDYMGKKWYVDNKQDTCTIIAMVHGQSQYKANWQTPLREKTRWSDLNVFHSTSKTKFTNTSLIVQKVLSLKVHRSAFYILHLQRINALTIYLFTSISNFPHRDLDSTALHQTHSRGIAI